MSHGSTLPFEIILQIVDHLRGRNATLASLTLCSKRFYGTCSPLLYRDIRLYKPTQLIALYECEQSRSKLDMAFILRVAESIFQDVTWEGVTTALRPADYLTHTLQATENLRQLQVMECDSPVSLSPGRAGTLVAEFNSQANSLLRDHPQSLLPRMHTLSVTRALHFLWATFKSRPLILISVSLRERFIATILPHHSRLDFSGASTPGLIIGHSPSSTSINMGHSIQDTISANLTHLSSINELILVTRSSDWVEDKTPVRETAIPWVQAMLMVLDQPKLETLRLDIGYPGADSSLNTQLEVVLDVADILPTVTEISLGIVEPEWRSLNHSMADEDIEDLELPFWTPRPNSLYPGVLEWWINALKLESPRGQHDEKLRRTARILFAGMYTRWTDLSLPSRNQDDLHFNFDVDTLCQRLAMYDPKATPTES